MADPKRDKIEERDIQGLKYFDQLAPLLARLHDDGCARDRAGNRTLHYDQYCLLILLYLFNPIVTSLRGLQQASELPKVQMKLGCSRASLGSLSEATTVFDPQRLQEIVQELGQQLQPLGRDPRLRDVPGALTAVDGSLLSVLPKIMQASCLKAQTGSGLVKWRLATNLLDVPAEIIALIYIYRWTIEIFFRFFKHVLGCRHLLSHSHNGIQIQTYCAIIACLLISLWTGRKPTLRTYEMICWYFTGMAGEEELLAHLAKLKAHDEAKRKT